MKRIGTLAAVLLVGTVVAAYAQKSPGASEYSPGDRMKDQPSTQSRENSPGASQYAPGHEQRTPGGASEMSPGDRMNDTRGQGGRQETFEKAPAQPGLSPFRILSCCGRGRNLMPSA